MQCFVCATDILQGVIKSMDKKNSRHGEKQHELDMNRLGKEKQ